MYPTQNLTTHPALERLIVHTRSEYNGRSRRRVVDDFLFTRGIFTCDMWRCVALRKHTEATIRACVAQRVSVDEATSDQFLIDYYILYNLAYYINECIHQ